MTIRPEYLRTIPLFRDLSDAHLAMLVDTLDKKTVAAGETLFRAGAMPNRFVLLVRGEVSLWDGADMRLRVRALAPLGELGAMTGIPRSMSAVTTTEAELWSADVLELGGFFERHGEIAIPFYRNFLSILSDKVRRDRRRLDEMRANVARTQIALKHMRDLVLESADPTLGASLFAVLDELIERNRRSHLRVAPVSSLPSAVRLADGTTVPILDFSDGYLKIVGTEVSSPEGSAWSGVLVLPTDELPLTGRIERAGRDGVVVKLDPLGEAHKQRLDDYATRVRMLDYLV